MENIFGCVRVGMCIKISLRSPCALDRTERSPTWRDTPLGNKDARPLGYGRLAGRRYANEDQDAGNHPVGLRCFPCRHIVVGGFWSQSAWEGRKP
jgi:hypothetical protein